MAHTRCCEQAYLPLFSNLFQSIFFKNQVYLIQKYCVFFEVNVVKILYLKKLRLNLLS